MKFLASAFFLALLCTVSCSSFTCNDAVQLAGILLNATNALGPAFPFNFPASITYLTSSKEFILGLDNSGVDLENITLNAENCLDFFTQVSVARDVLDTKKKVILSLLLSSVTRYSPSTSTAPTDIIPFLKIAKWKVQVPDDNPGDNKDLDDPLGYKSEFFYGNDYNSTVVFRTPCNNKTTTGSTSPRSELREYYNGKDSWNATDGNPHMLQFSGRINAVPSSNPRIIIAQLFGMDTVKEDGKDKKGNFIVQIRYNRYNDSSNQGELVVLSNAFRTKKKIEIILVSNYVEGTPYEIELSLAPAVFSDYTSSSSMTITYKDLSTQSTNETIVEGIVSTQAYFKAGCYLNLPSRVVNDEFGLVLMTSLTSSHV